MKTIIYFGHHKVGSTALQSFLFQNQEALMRHGLLYPATESEGLSYALARLVLGSGPAARAGQFAELQKSPVPMNAREPHNALAFQMLAQANGGKAPKWHGGLPGVVQMIRTIRQQAKFLQPEAVLLCSEVMANFGPQHPGLIDRVRDIFPNSDHVLYCVLRRPDDYLVSWHAQRLRFGDKVKALSGGAALGYAGSIHFNYRKVVEPWVRVFPDAPLHLRNYTDVLAAGGSVEDFLDRTGLAVPRGLETGVRANSSLPRAAMEIARRGNHDLPPDQAQALRQHLLDLRPEQLPVPNRDVEMFGAELRAQMAERFAPVHAYLSELTGQPAFFPDIEEMTRPRPVPEAEAVAALLDRLPVQGLPGPLAAYIDSLRRDYAA